MKKILFILINAYAVNIHSQCCLTDTYLSSTGWTMNGLYYSIGPNTFSFNATPCDASSSNAFSYATRSLSCKLSESAWIGDVDFEYTGRGAGTSHVLLAATAGTLNTWNTASFGSTNQDAIAMVISSPINLEQTSDSIFGSAKLGATWNPSSKGIALSMNVQYYLRVERVSSTLGRINLFIDAARTVQAPGSPQTFSINAAVKGLNVVQHGCIPQGYYTRTLTATLDNLNICDNIDAGLGLEENQNIQTIINIFPNPFSNSTILQTDNTFHNATLTVDNCFGQTVAQIKNINMQTITLHRENLLSGLYFVRLTQDNKVIATDKLVITDK